jgi:hypothetical protein
MQNYGVGSGKCERPRWPHSVQVGARPALPRFYLKVPSPAGCAAQCPMPRPRRRRLHVPCAGGWLYPLPSAQFDSTPPPEPDRRGPRSAKLAIDVLVESPAKGRKAQLRTVCSARPGTVCSTRPGTVCSARPGTGAGTVCSTRLRTVCSARPGTVCSAGPGTVSAERRSPPGFFRRRSMAAPKRGRLFPLGPIPEHCVPRRRRRSRLALEEPGTIGRSGLPIVTAGRRRRRREQRGA